MSLLWPMWITIVYGLSWIILGGAVGILGISIVGFIPITLIYKLGYYTPRYLQHKKVNKKVKLPIATVVQGEK